MHNLRKYSVIFILFIVLPVLICGCGAWRSRQAPRVIISGQDPASRMFPFPVSPEEISFKVPEPVDYKIGIDDVLEIFVFRHPDLCSEVTVRPDGKISYLLIGDVQAAGLTVAELDDAITKKFEEYAVNKSSKELMEAPLSSDYRVNLGDELAISVWKEPDLSLKAIVRPDGKISYPLAGDILAYNKTLTEVDQELTQKLSKYIKNSDVSIMVTRFGQMEGQAYIAGFISMYVEKKPDISVLVKKFGSRKVIVLGEIEEPGVYDLQGNARLLDAIGYGEGFTDNAVRDNIFVIRGNISRDPTVIEVNAWDIIRRGNFALNILLQDQDIVYVPRSIVGNFNVLIGQVRPTVDLMRQVIPIQEGWD